MSNKRILIAAIVALSATAAVSIARQQGAQQAQNGQGQQGGQQTTLAPSTLAQPLPPPLIVDPAAPPPGAQPLERRGYPSPNAYIRPGGERFAGFEMAPPPVKVPDGFTPIFNGVNLDGWHVSRTNIHGTTPDFHVMHGILIGTQSPLGVGGVLLTDKKYKNFELYMEVKPDWGCDSGLFFRSTEAGQAYQVSLDYLPTGMLGNITGENGVTGIGGAQAGRGRGAAQGGQGAAPAAAPPGQMRGGLFDDVKAWKREQWNAIRIRVEGDIPHIQMWVNDVKITDFTDVANNAVGGATDGMLALQVHGQYRWQPGGFWRWRNIGIKELP